VSDGKFDTVMTLGLRYVGLDIQKYQVRRVFLHKLTLASELRTACIVLW